jgi:hypothetical protein
MSSLKDIDAIDLEHAKACDDIQDALVLSAIETTGIKG